MAFASARAAKEAPTVLDDDIEDDADDVEENGRQSTPVVDGADSASSGTPTPPPPPSSSVDADPNSSSSPAVVAATAASFRPSRSSAREAKRLFPGREMRKLIQLQTRIGRDVDRRAGRGTTAASREYLIDMAHRQNGECV